MQQDKSLCGLPDDSLTEGYVCFIRHFSATPPVHQLSWRGAVVIIIITGSAELRQVQDGEEE